MLESIAAWAKIPASTVRNGVTTWSYWPTSVTPTSATLPFSDWGAMRPSTTSPSETVGNTAPGPG